jgi:hypothetical protein
MEIGSWPGRNKRRIVHFTMLILLMAGGLIYYLSGDETPLLLIMVLDFIALLWETKKRVEEGDNL